MIYILLLKYFCKWQSTSSFMYSFTHFRYQSQKNDSSLHILYIHINPFTPKNLQSKQAACTGCMAPQCTGVDDWCVAKATILALLKMNPCSNPWDVSRNQRAPLQNLVSPHGALVAQNPRMEPLHCPVCPRGRCSCYGGIYATVLQCPSLRPARVHSLICVEQEQFPYPAQPIQFWLLWAFFFLLLLMFSHVHWNCRDVQSLQFQCKSNGLFQE